MYRGVSVAVVMPAYNVEEHIEEAVRTLPLWVDRIFVVDDASSDSTSLRVESLAREELTIIRHQKNSGVGAAINSGYQSALEQHFDIIVVMAGDGQMDPADLSSLIDPIVDERADYVKGNRFLHADIWRAMPKARIFGNIVLSLLTKISSGYYRSFDSQCGYTAIRARAYHAIQGEFYSRYGYPNDLLARLKVAGAKVEDVCVRPVYDGQSSGISILTVFYPMLFVLGRSYFWRLTRQYLAPLFGKKTKTLIHDQEEKRALAARR